MLDILLLATLLQGPPATPDPRAARLLDTAMARMGGAQALERIERVRLDMLTQWQRTAFDQRPYADLPSYEWHVDVRDYAIPAWRNTRRFKLGGVEREVTDVVRDSVAIRRGPDGKWAPLNVAYVDERRELFTFAVERLLPLARHAPDLRLLADTTIAGIAHARIAATVDRFPATIFLRRTDGLPAMVRWRAPHPNDFGLVPWGEMDVELWYSNWQRTSAGLALPMQWDVRRVGRPYKRMSVLGVAFDTAATADSFAVSDSLRAAFFATANRPMHDVPFDSARVAEPGLVDFRSAGAPAGAVKLGAQWVLLEAGQAPLSAERAVEWLRRNEPGAKVGGAIVTLVATGNGGAAWLAGERVPLHLAPGARPFVRTVLRNHRRPEAAATAVTKAGWLRVSGDSLWLEPIDLPDAPGALLVYAPSLRWVYSATAFMPLHAEYLRARMRERGWPVERIGSMRNVSAPVPPQSASR
ncbi:MAG TPA: hypothetical protein VNK43_05160 [Gemmatimonadales bacterium]|nr:hypothetical protein [Gemmatimonadales bacterium]